MGRIVHTQVQQNATLTTTGSAVIALPESYVNPEVICVVKVGANPTGTSPSLTVSIAPSVDGTRVSAAQAGTAITAATTSDQRLALAQVLEGFAIVTWTISGTGSPTFTQVYIDVYYSTEQ